MSERIAVAQLIRVANARPAAARDNSGQLSPDSGPKGAKPGYASAGFASQLVEVATASIEARPAAKDLPATAGRPLPRPLEQDAPTPRRDARSPAGDARSPAGNALSLPRDALVPARDASAPAGVARSPAGVSPSPAGVSPSPARVSHDAKDGRPRAQLTGSEMSAHRSFTQPTGVSGLAVLGDNEAALSPSGLNGKSLAQNSGLAQEAVGASIEILSNTDGAPDGASWVNRDGGGGSHGEDLRDAPRVDGAVSVKPTLASVVQSGPPAEIVPAPSVPTPSVPGPAVPGDVLPALSQRADGSRATFRPLAARLTRTAPLTVVQSLTAEQSGGQSQKPVLDGPIANAPAMTIPLPQSAGLIAERPLSAMPLGANDSLPSRSAMPLQDMPGSVAFSAKPAAVAQKPLLQPGSREGDLLPSMKVSVTRQETHFSPATSRDLLAQQVAADKPTRASRQDVPPIRAADTQPASAKEVTPALQPAPATQFALAEQLSPLAPAASPIEQISDKLRRDLRAARNSGIATAPVAGTKHRSPVRVLTIQLQPADLGTVSVRISLKDNMLQLKFDASQQETTRLLEQSRTALVTALRREGFSIDVLGVQISQSGGPQLSATAQPAAINGGAAAEQFAPSPESQSGDASGDRSHDDGGHKGDSRRLGEAAVTGAGDGVAAQQGARSGDVYI